ncbi:hypothetical protein GUJ93_ZPchr0009g1291 [Zizania palustris]|uniref:Secreted protein n=1 Tax=Zizania palustris TaxID=103762 RepID=A0A8J5R832_ZIZPA|nr:hypothetical protein GUJ93_ZPchr0009g1291 [Zizania palustris]
MSGTQIWRIFMMSVVLGLEVVVKIVDVHCRPGGSTVGVVSVARVVWRGEAEWVWVQAGADKGNACMGVAQSTRVVRLGVGGPGS